MSDRNLFTAPARPRRLQIEITTGCNLRCVGCQRTLGMAAGTWRNAHMPLERFAAVLGNAPPAEAIILQGIGEPTLHPALPRLVAMARDTGKYGVISFNTNALVREAAYYADLRRAGLGHVSISVDSLDPETATALREGTDTDQLRAALRDLTRLFGRSVTLSIVLSRRNLSGLEALLDELHALGGRIVEVQPLVSYAAAIDPMALTDADRGTALAAIARVRARLPDLTVMPAAGLTPNGSRCRRPFHALYVTQGGFLTPCCLTNDPDLMGRVSLAEMPFEQAWQMPGVRRFTAGFFDREPAFCHGCAFNPSGAQPAGFADEALAQAEAALRDGDLARARDGFRRVAGDRATVEAVHGLGLTHLMGGAAGDAVPLLRTAQALAPGPRVTHNLAMALEKADHRDEAIALERANITAHPAYVPSWHGLSAALDAAGDRSAAALVELTLAERAAAGGNAAIVATASARAAMLDPAHPALPRVANRLRIAGQTEPALTLLNARLAHDPDDLGARLSRAMARLTVIHGSVAEIAERRTAYLAELAALEERIRDAPAQALLRAADQVGSAKPFYLAYQAEDDTAAQRRYGRIVSRMMAALPPAAPPRAQPSGAGAPIQVGFATAYFHLHSVSKLFGGWIRHLDRTRFEVLGYHLGEGEDGMSADLARHCARFHRGPRTEADWVRTIQEDRLDVLIYPEIGMHPLPPRLACRRLAPVQCMAWGHPVTSGLPAIDYFLSSDLMEPEDAERHYTEVLVRLPNLSIRYEPPPTDTGSLTRAGLGLDDAGIVYLCCQSLFKYHPADDPILPAIARRVPLARFLFIGAPATDPNARRLRERLAAAFVAAGLDPDRHLIFTPPVPAEEFPALLRAGDVYLDSPRWSGGNTTLEAMAAGLPIVTLPGTMMRGRHSAAILLAAGAEAWIAWSADRYVALAASLADPVERARARAAIIAGRASVFNDAAPVPALETFLAEAVGAARARTAA
jgi:predicted O-linked N-acetylglucosamine transferase (SPINDLY family)/MoaA/NifB/PqqE/SkfB family radical SAM enzyme